MLSRFNGITSIKSHHGITFQAPSKHEWDSGLAAFEDALALEKEVNSKLLTLHHTAEDDPHVSTLPSWDSYHCGESEHMGPTGYLFHTGLV